MSTPAGDPDDVVQIVMLDVLRPAFEAWLASRRLALAPLYIPKDLLTYVVIPAVEEQEGPPPP